MSILAIGDFHIPYLSPGIPKCFVEVLNSSEINSVFCTGNLCTWGVFKLLQGINSEVYIVKGKKDDHLFQESRSKTAPPTIRVVIQKGYRIGLASDLSLIPVSDPLMLSLIADSLHVEVLIFGGSPTFQSFTYGGRIFISPGSATGAFEPAITINEIKQTLPIFSNVEVVDFLNSTPGFQEQQIISTYKFDYIPKLYVPTFILLSLGTVEEYGKVEVQVHTLLNNKLEVETLSYDINPNL